MPTSSLCDLNKSGLIRIFVPQKIFFMIDIKYNTAKERLFLPDYGRNIQNMVNHCMTIETREERNKCAHSIINIMGNLFPHLRDISDFKHILWDHLAIMSDFTLEVDYPYDIIKKRICINVHRGWPTTIPISLTAIMVNPWSE